MPTGYTVAIYDGLEKSDGYYPIRMVKSYSLKRLPSLKKMAKDVDPQEE